MKAILVSIDAMFSDQVAELQARPKLAPFWRHCLTALDMRAVYPALTYPCHASILSGNPPAIHGIFHNLDCVPGAKYRDWKWYYRDIQCKTLLDSFREAGWSTAAVFWPVTANGPVDYLVPEIWSYTDDPVNVIKETGTRNTWHIIDRHREDVDFSSKYKLDRFAADCAKDIAREFDPDVLLLHLSLVDHVRHRYGIHHEKVKEAFDQCCCWLEEVLEQVRSPLEALTLVVLGDHGHLNCQGSLSVNRLFTEKGWLPENIPGQRSQCPVYCHAAGVSAQVYLRDESLRQEVEALFEELKSQGWLMGWYTTKQCRKWGLDGPFQYVLEAADGFFFTDERKPQFYWPTPAQDGGDRIGKHGHNPLRGERPPFLVAAPGLKSVQVRDYSILDIAPTLCERFHLPCQTMSGHSILSEDTGSV